MLICASLLSRFDSCRWWEGHSWIMRAPSPRADASVAHGGYGFAAAGGLSIRCSSGLSEPHRRVAARSPRRSLRSDVRRISPNQSDSPATMAHVANSSSSRLEKNLQRSWYMGAPAVAMLLTRPSLRAIQNLLRTLRPLTTRRLAGTASVCRDPPTLLRGGCRQFGLASTRITAPAQPVPSPDLARRQGLQAWSRPGRAGQQSLRAGRGLKVDDERFHAADGDPVVGACPARGRPAPVHVPGRARVARRPSGLDASWVSAYLESRSTRAVRHPRRIEKRAAQRWLRLDFLQLSATCQPSGSR